FHYDDQTVNVARDGSSDSAGDVHTEEVDGGYLVLAQLPLETAADEGDTVLLNIEITDDDSTAASWAAEGAMGEVELVEELSFVEVPEAAISPTIDGNVDDAWD